MLGVDLNRLEPSIPGKISPSYSGNLIHAATNSAGSVPSGNSNGQKGEDNHFGMTKVPWDFVIQACLTALGTKWMGGTHQLLSSIQLQVKASTASAPGAQNLELNLLS